MRERHPDPRRRAADRRQACRAAGRRARRRPLRRGAAAGWASRRQCARPRARRRAGLRRRDHHRRRSAARSRARRDAAGLAHRQSRSDQAGCLRAARGGEGVARRRGRPRRVAACGFGALDGRSETQNHRVRPCLSRRDRGARPPPAGPGGRNRVRALLPGRGDRRVGACQPRRGGSRGGRGCRDRVDRIEGGRTGDPCAGSIARGSRPIFPGRAPAFRNAAVDPALGGGVSRDRLLGRGRGRGARRCRPRGRARRGAAPVAACDLCRGARGRADRRGDGGAAARPAGDHRDRPGRRGMAHPRGERPHRRRRGYCRLPPVPRSPRSGDRRQAPPRQRDRSGGGAGAARPRPGRRGRQCRAGVVGRCRHLRPRRAGLRAARSRTAPRLERRRYRRRTGCQRDAGRRRPGRGSARARFLCDFAVRPLDPVGADPRPDRGGGAGRSRHRAL